MQLTLWQLLALFDKYFDHYSYNLVHFNRSAIALPCSHYKSAMSLSRPRSQLLGRQAPWTPAMAALRHAAPQQRAAFHQRAEPLQRASPHQRAEPQQSAPPHHSAEPQQRAAFPQRADPLQRAAPYQRAEPQKRGAASYASADTSPTTRKSLLPPSPLIAAILALLVLGMAVILAKTTCAEAPAGPKVAVSCGDQLWLRDHRQVRERSRRQLTQARGSANLPSP